jgi:hypothetical protein
LEPDLNHKPGAKAPGYLFCCKECFLRHDDAGGQRGAACDGKKKEPADARESKGWLNLHLIINEEISMPSINV